MHVALSVLPAACAVGRTRSVKMNIMALALRCTVFSFSRSFKSSEAIKCAPVSMSSNHTETVVTCLVKAGLFAALYLRYQDDVDATVAAEPMKVLMIGFCFPVYTVSC